MIDVGHGLNQPSFAHRYISSNQTGIRRIRHESSKAASYAVTKLEGPDHPRTLGHCWGTVIDHRDLIYEVKRFGLH